MWNWPAYLSTSSTSSTWDTSSHSGNDYINYYNLKYEYVITPKEPDPPKELFFDPKNLW